MATGNAQSAYLKNLPASGKFTINPEQFFLLTERNEMPLNAIDVAAFGRSYQAKIQNVGIIGALILNVTGTITTTAGTGTLTATRHFPWNVLERVIVSANGQNELISVEGMDLRARWLRIYRNATDPISTTSTTISATTQVDLMYVIPFAHDDTTLIGSLYAQSDETYLNLSITTANAADLITATGNATVNAISLTVTPHVVFYEVPELSNGADTVLVLPDLTQLHGLNMIDNPFANTGDVATKLLRSSGQLLCVYGRLDNDGATPAALNPWSDLNELRWNYAGNQTPRKYNPSRLLEFEMAGNYAGTIDVDAQHYFLLDFEVYNPMRDVVYPKGVIDLQVVAQVKTGTTVNANAKVHVMAETLYGGQ